MIDDDRKFKLAWAILGLSFLLVGIPIYAFFRDLKLALGAFLLTGLFVGGFVITVIEHWDRIRRYFI